VVLFDLDGTLVRGDCVARFLRRQLRSSRWRRFAAVPLLPLLPLLGNWRTAWIPASGFSWLATVGRRDAVLRAQLEAYVAELAADPRRWLISAALLRLRAHCEAGDPVTIITGAYEPLAASLWRALAPEFADLPVLGSRIRRFAGGQVAALHCVGERKLRRLAEAGIRPPFAAMYSDSRSDLPVLRLAHRAVLVAPPRGQRAGLRRALPDAEWLDIAAT